MVSEGLTHRVRPPAGEAEGLFVLLHGRGTDEHDLFPLFDVLDPERRLLGVTPRGPLSLPPGGRHWYVIREVGYPDPDTFHATIGLLSRWLEGLGEEAGIPIERTVIGGFSQGTVMSYALALGAGRPSPAGIMALSGFMPRVDGYRLELEGREGLRVAICHGTLDPIIDVNFSREARARLEAAGLEVLYRESPVPHTIDPRFIPELREWLAETVKRAGAHAPPGCS
jgi:phospholipase/carboxylesterase